MEHVCSLLSLFSSLPPSFPSLLPDPRVRQENLLEVKVQVEFSDPTDARGFKLGSSKARMRSVLESAYQPLRYKGLGRSVILRAGTPDAEKIPLSWNKIRFLVWGVHVCGHLGRGFSPTHILSPPNQQAGFKAGLEDGGLRGPGIQSLCFWEWPTALFMVIFCSPHILALPSGALP